MKAADCSMLGIDAIIMLYHCAKICVGDILEVGAYTGGATIAMAMGVRDSGTEKKIISIERGCRVDLPTGSFRIDSKLGSATLASTHLTIVDEGCEKFGCDPGAGRDVVVSATWTGFGPLRTTKSRSSDGDGTCRVKSSFKGSSRPAEFVGSIDGHPFVLGDSYGSLSAGKYSFVSTCTEV